MSNANESCIDFTETVVSQYERVSRTSDRYESESELEREFIRVLSAQGYEYLPIHSESDLIANLRVQLERLNNFRFSDAEWSSFFQEKLANSTEGIVEKTRKIQEDSIQVLTREDGTSKNVRLLEKRDVDQNFVQVINQYEVGTEQGADYANRYDVTILVNGLPLCCVELKRRGVAIREAFNQIERYQRDSFWSGCGLFEYVQLFVISNGVHTKYYSNTTRFNAIQESSRASSRVSSKRSKTSHSFEFTSCWSDFQNRAITDLIDFARTFFAKRTFLNVLTRYCVFTCDRNLLVMRPYQIAATERILARVYKSQRDGLWGTVASGGYVWHATGSGKTLTSFKTACLIRDLDFVDKVLFVVDRKDLDYQTMKEYDRFEKGAANGNKSTAILTRQLNDPSARIVITTIQKLSTFVKQNPARALYERPVVMIFDECHRSQFGDMRVAITKAFKKYCFFGFTGTPIFASNATGAKRAPFFTTEQTFGERLHAYTIVDAINDKNVLPFRVDYVRTMRVREEMEDEEVPNIDREKAFMAPERIRLVTRYILARFDQKTYRAGRSYSYATLSNVQEVASSSRGEVAEIKEKRRIRGFNSIFAVSSTTAAKLYYEEFRRQTQEPGGKKLKIATIFSFAPNESEEAGGLLGEENPEDASALDQSSRDFLEGTIRDYNAMFGTSYDSSSDKFQNYYKDVSLRMKNKEIDLLIVVNMFLTGFDATTLNTLWVDKNLRAHGLIQAFSRTNRILNSIKTFGNIVCFRNLQKQVDEAVALFGNERAGGIVLLKKFEDYYYGYEDDEGKKTPGYVDMIDELTNKFPLPGPIIGEGFQREFIALFGGVLRMRNLLASFDEFEGKEILSERDFQDYLGIYQDLRDEWKKPSGGDGVDPASDIVFEIELVKQVEINIDYILFLVQKYRDSRCGDKEILIAIQKAVDSSPELRSKRELIEKFVAAVDGYADVQDGWNEFVDESREKDLATIVKEERLKENETRKLLENAFRDGEIKTKGTEFDKIMPPVSRFGGGRDQKKKTIIEKLSRFFEKYFGIGLPFCASAPETNAVSGA